MTESLVISGDRAEVRALCSEGGGDAQLQCSPQFLPSRVGYDLNLSSVTKLKDLPSPCSCSSVLLSLLCWASFTAMRWKCDTVWWDSCLGPYRRVEVCVTYFQRLLAAPRTAAEDCYDSFPLRAQKSIFPP